MPGLSCLIVYATREGQTEKISRSLAEHLSQRGAAVTLQDAREPFSLDLGAFDYLVCGASMHAGGLEKEIRAFIQNRDEAIRRLPRSFFLVLLSAATKDRALREEWLRDAETKYEQQITLPFNRLEMIAGALRYSKYPLPLKWVMKRIAEKAGEGTDVSRDYEYTDWEQVERFADKIMSELTGQV
jgi:menaquinone-dependent protoporphyrinogen oxidase